MLALVQPVQRLARRFGRARLHSPLAGLQPEHAPVRGVVVDDEHALAGERGLHADELALPCRRQVGDAVPDREQERRSLARSLALRPHMPAHELAQALADREAQARAAVLARRGRVRLRERLEQPAHRIVRQADPGVADGEGQLDLIVGARFRHSPSALLRPLP